jgi:hypothetical protein
MSPFEPLEFTMNPEIENSLADIILANSSETAQKLDSMGIDLDRIEVFGNPAPRVFFDFPQNQKSNSYFLFITNHPPLEILEAMEILSERGETFIHIGMGSKWADARRVTPKDLAEASVVISIGKTIQYAIAMKKTFYIYDHFGGDGFISSIDNFKSNSFFNFSGRNNRKVKRAEDIVYELLNYSKNDPFVSGYVTDQDFAHFNLQLRLNLMLADLDFSEKSHFLDKLDHKQVNVFSGTIEVIRRSLIQESLTSKTSVSALAERDSALAERDSALAERDSALAERDSALAERDSALAERDSIASSTIWKLFGPYRKLIRFIRRI